MQCSSEKIHNIFEVNIGLPPMIRLNNQLSAVSSEQWVSRFSSSTVAPFVPLSFAVDFPGKTTLLKFMTLVVMNTKFSPYPYGHIGAFYFEKEKRLSSLILSKKTLSLQRAETHITRDNYHLLSSGLAPNVKQPKTGEVLAKNDD